MCIIIIIINVCNDINVCVIILILMNNERK